MRYLKKALWGRILAIFVMACFIFNMSVLTALAQEEEAAATEEVAAEVEALSVPN